MTKYANVMGMKTKKRAGPADYKKRAEICKALGHPTRLFILDRLAKGERCVCEFADLVDSDFSTVSRHLAVLRHAGLIADEKRGKQVYYRLACPCALDFFKCLEAVQKEGKAKR